MLGGGEVRWLLMAVIEKWGLKKKRRVSGIISEAEAQLGLIPELIHTEMVIRVLMPSGHPPLLSTVLAPG